MSDKRIGKFFVVYVKKRSVSPESSKFSLTMKVNRSIRQAIHRNRIKRVLREFFRKRFESSGKDVVCVALPEGEKAENHDLFQDLEHLFY